MTTAHVSGVVALVLSRRIQGFQFGPDAGQVDAVRSLLSLSADPTACPASDVLAQYAPLPSLNNDAPQTCQGTPTVNGWYGAGLVNALSAMGLAVPD